MNKLLIFVFFGSVMAFLGIGFMVKLKSQTEPARVLPTYGLNRVDTTINGRDTTVKEVHRVLPFRFTNQAGKSITEAHFQGKIYATDFFFTSCQGICPQLTGTLQKVYSHYKGDEHVFFLSHTVDPENDTPETLLAYAKAHGASLPQWQFVTGEAKTLYKQARKGYLIDNRDGVQEGAFVHSQLIALVDPEGRIRGFYDGTKPDTHEKLVRDILLLKKEYGFVEG